MNRATQILQPSVLLDKSDIKAAMGLVSFEVPFLMAASPSSCKDPSQIGFTHHNGLVIALIVSSETSLPNIDILRYWELGIHYKFGREVAHLSP